MATRAVVTVGALLVRDERALLLRRHAGEAGGDALWDLPGGHLLEHEDDIDAAVPRMLTEALGVLPTAFEFYDTQFAPLAGGEPRVDSLYIVIEWEGDPRLAATDVFASIEWLPLVELAEAALVEPRRSLVRSLLGIDEPE